MIEFPTARFGALFVWILSFVVFTFLQLKYNKTPLSFDGVVVCSVSDAIEVE